MKTIDITPTWSALILPMVEVLKNPKADPQAKKDVQAELLRLAKIVDDQNEKARMVQLDKKARLWWHRDKLDKW